MNLRRRISRSIADCGPHLSPHHTPLHRFLQKCFVLTEETHFAFSIFHGSCTLPANCVRFLFFLCLFCTAEEGKIAVQYLIEIGDADHCDVWTLLPWTEIIAEHGLQPWSSTKHFCIFDIPGRINEVSWSRYVSFVANKEKKEGFTHTVIIIRQYQTGLEFKQKMRFSAAFIF